MYKVFIDNKSVIFNLSSDKELCKMLSDHKYVEAAGGIVEHNGKYLFIKRNDVWDIPKGKLDKGETPEIAAVREIEEECGLVKPRIKCPLISTWHTYLHNEKKVLKKTYWYLLSSTQRTLTLVPQQEEGISEVKLFDRSEFGIVKGNTYLSILEVISALEKIDSRKE